MRREHFILKQIILAAVHSIDATCVSIKKTEEYEYTAAETEQLMEELATELTCDQIEHAADFLDALYELKDSEEKVRR